MKEPDLERILGEAFTARANSSVSEGRPVPPPRFATEPAPARRRVPWLAPLAAAVAVLGLVGGVLAVARTGRPSDSSKVAGGHSAVPTSTSTGVTSDAARPARTVHIKLFNADHATYGVGMPVVAIFSHKISNARPFVQATRVTVNDKPVQAAWYFEHSAAGLGAMEAHLRPEQYWPAHARVHVSLDTRGRAAGKGMAYDDSLTLDFTTGPRTIATVDDSTNVMTVTSDRKQLGKYPVMLGDARTPTLRGTKVIMAKAGKVRLRGPGYNEIVSNAQRLTDSGEYLYGAPWGNAATKANADVTQGCTVLLPKDAARLYDVLEVGDVVRYLNSSRPQVSVMDGFGDWNVPWTTWVKGGLLPTS